MTEEIKEEQTIVPEIVDKGGERAVQVFDENAVNKMAEPFFHELEKLDNERGYSLTGLMKECLALHAENAMVRTNMAQTQVIIQEQLKDWTTMRIGLGKQMEKLEPTDETYVEKMQAIQDLNASVTKSMALSQKILIAFKKEIRNTEFQSRYTMHMSLFQTFMLSLRGVMRKHLQSTGAFDAMASDIDELAGFIETME